MSDAAMALSTDHPIMVAWKAFQETDEFKNALKWSLALKYDDSRLIDFDSREAHIKGGLWLAFTKGMDVAVSRLEEVERENPKRDLEAGTPTGWGLPREPARIPIMALVEKGIKQKGLDLSA